VFIFLSGVYREPEAGTAHFSYCSELQSAPAASSQQTPKISLHFLAFLFHIATLVELANPSFLFWRERRLRYICSNLNTVMIRGLQFSALNFNPDLCLWLDLNGYIFPI